MDIASGDMIANGLGANALFSPRGAYLVGNASDNLYIYRTSDWQEHTQIGLRAGLVTARDWSFSPDDHYLASFISSRVTIWSVEDRRRVREIKPLAGAKAVISQAFFSEDSSQMAVVEVLDRQAHLLIWDILDGSLVSRQTAEEAGIYTYDLMLLDADGLHGFQVPWESDRSAYQAPQWEGGQVALDLTNESLSAVDFVGRDEVTNQPIYKVCTFVFLPVAEPFCWEVSGVSNSQYENGVGKSQAIRG